MNSNLFYFFRSTNLRLIARQEINLKHFKFAKVFLFIFDLKPKAFAARYFKSVNIEKI